MRQSSKPFLCACVLFSVSLAAQNTLTPPAPAQPFDEQAVIAAALAQTKAHQDAAALQLYSQILAHDPSNAPVNLLAAGAAIESLQMDLALKYVQRAQQLDPTAWKVHLTLVVAYSGTGKIKERDQERELVRQFHTDGKHPDAAQSNGFMVDYFACKDYRVRAVEYFTPIGKPHFAYRFLVYGPERKEIWAVALESDDLDQASWASAHKQLAASGEREYSLDGYGAGSHISYRDYSGKPSYDQVKEDVIKILAEHPLPPSANAQGPANAQKP